MAGTRRDTTLARRLDALDVIYARIEREQAEFRRSAAERGKAVACPPRCGNCCVHFVPDAMPIEADRLALFLLTERPAAIDRFFALRDGARARDSACPFWDESKPGENCGVYPGRPLVCRLFGFCSMLSKTGEPAFALCHGMRAVPGEASRHFAGAARMTELFGAVPLPWLISLARSSRWIPPRRGCARRYWTPSPRPSPGSLSCSSSGPRKPSPTTIARTSNRWRQPDRPPPRAAIRACKKATAAIGYSRPEAETA